MNKQNEIKVTYVTKDDKKFLKLIQDLKTDERALLYSDLENIWIGKADSTMVILKKISIETILGYCLDIKNLDKMADISGDRIELIKKQKPVNKNPPLL